MLHIRFSYYNTPFKKRMLKAYIVQQSAFFYYLDFSINTSPINNKVVSTLYPQNWLNPQ